MSISLICVTINELEQFCLLQPEDEFQQAQDCFHRIWILLYTVTNLGIYARPLFFSPYDSFLFILPFISTWTSTLNYPYLTNTCLLIHKIALCHYDST